MKTGALYQPPRAVAVPSDYTSPFLCDIIYLN